MAKFTPQFMRALYFKETIDPMASPYLNKIGKELERSGIVFELADNSVFVPLPNDFGVVEVHEYEEGKDIVELSNSIWATHGYLLAQEYNFNTSEAGIIRHFIERIFSGQLKMVIAKDEFGGPYKAIWNSNEIRSADNEKYAYEIQSEI